jgi:hypothetical protein
MKTDDLIRAMAADATPARPVEAALPLALALSAAFSGAVYLLQAGIRPDLGEALTHGRVIVKQIFPWLLAIGGLGAVLRLSRPGFPGVSASRTYSKGLIYNAFRRTVVDFA